MDTDDFKAWFPASAMPRFKDFNPPDPKMRVIAFPNAGNSEDVFTSEGSGSRRQPSPVIEWCKENHGQLLAVQYPGRYARKKEPFASSAQEIAAGLLRVLSPILDTPYVILAHSVGTWISFELLTLIRQEGLPMPCQVIYSAFPSPDLSVEDRPWKVGKELNEEDFKDEARDWDVTEDVFHESLWSPDGWNFHAILRADFALFDSYVFDPGKAEPFDVPIQTYFASRDKKVTREMVMGWENFTTARFGCDEIEGHHLFPLEKEGKARWLNAVAMVISDIPPMESAPAEEVVHSDEDDLEFFM